MPRAYVCDFDGTIAPEDIGAAIMHRFTSATPGELEALLSRWKRGEIGSREVTEAECRTLEVSAPEALTFSRTFSIDPHFATFVEATTGRGDVVLVASEGFEFYILDQLARANLDSLPVAANRARFVGRTLVPEFRGPAPCGRCGTCKAEHVREFQSRGYRTVFVGDGLSDRCGAGAADRVFARRALLDWCRAEHIDADPFDNFEDVIALECADELAPSGPLTASASVAARSAPGPS